MEVVIAKDWQGKVISIVAARSKELALAYFHGAKIEYNTAETLEEMNITDIASNGVSGVVPILTTTTLRIKQELKDGAVIVK